jgi:hypothetical protein
MRRRAIIALAFLLLFGVAGAAWWLCQESEPSINFHSFVRISKGMNEEEVEELLGGPAGYYTRDFVGTDYREGPNRVTGIELCQRQGGRNGLQITVASMCSLTNAVSFLMLDKERAS